MNKIIIDNEKSLLVTSDGNLSFKTDESSKFLNVQNLNVKISSDTDLIIECTGNGDIKFDIYINVLEGVKANIYELKKDAVYKSQYKYYLEKDSYLNVQRVISSTSINDMTIINLNGDNAKVDYNLKTVCKSFEKYNYLVYHNARKTSSNIINNGVNILEGELEFNVSSFVPNDIKKCYVNQESRIINMTDNLCIIKPNLFIDEEDVIASHSALIGTFSSFEIFYLMSRGISKKESDRLLTKGFLMKGISYHKDDLKEIIDKYWR